jgi:hypothetical protein
VVVASIEQQSAWVRRAEMSAVITSLAEIRERAEAVSEAVAQLADAAIEANTAQVPEGVARPAILARIASSFDVPVLLAAIDAVLNLADELDTEDGYDAEAEPDLGYPASRGDRIRRTITQALPKADDPKGATDICPLHHDLSPFPLVKRYNRGVGPAA